MFKNIQSLTGGCIDDFQFNIQKDMNFNKIQEMQCEFHMNNKSTE